MILALDLDQRQPRLNRRYCAQTKRYSSNLTDEERERILPLLPKSPKRGQQANITDIYQLAEDYLNAASMNCYFRH